MTSPAYNQLITDLSREIVAQTAPEELPLFRAISDEYIKNPEKTLKGQMGKDEDLGFGVTEATLLLTPIIFDVMKDVVKFLLDKRKKSLKMKSPEAKYTIIKRMFNKNLPVDTMSKQEGLLTSEQLLQVHQLALNKAQQILPEDQAILLANSIVENLVVAR
jgi:hypothetical protein